MRNIYRRLNFVIEKIDYNPWSDLLYGASDFSHILSFHRFYCSFKVLSLLFHMLL
jgi:hypothetical protein